MSTPEGQNTFLPGSDSVCPMCHAQVPKLKQHVCAGKGPSEFEKRGKELLDAAIAAPEGEDKAQALRRLCEHITPARVEHFDPKQRQIAEDDQ